MAINYNGTGGLFVRLGKIFYVAEVIESFQGTCRDEIDDVLDVFVNDVASLWQVTPLSAMRDHFASPMSSRLGTLESVAKTVVIEAVKDGLLLQPANFEDALRLLVEDMKSGSTKTIASGSTTNTIFIEANTVSESLAATSVVANGGTVITANNMPMSVLATAVQKKNQGVFAEAIKIECVQDESAGTNPGAELFRVTGKQSKHVHDFEWPLGSGVSHMCQVVSAADNATPSASGYPSNILTNSGFDTWSAATAPIHWTADSSRASGSYSTGGHDSTGEPIHQKNINFTPDGAYSIEFNGDGNEKHRIYQEFGKAAGTLGRIKPDKQYVFSCRIRSTSGTISAGVISAAIANAAYSKVTTATTTLDFSSTNITDSTWVHLQGVWQTDNQDLGNDARLVLDFTTALENGKSLIVDEMILAEPKALYPGGPAITIVRGAADFLIENYFTLTIANNNSSKMQRYFRKLLGTERTGKQLPVAGGTEMADSLIG